MRHFLVLIVVISLVSMGCTDPTEATSSSKPSIPDDVSYFIVDSDIMPGVKRSLDVLLNKKVSEDVLRAIAIELKSQDSREYDRTFIMYYLPGMTIGSGAWATTHFNPTLEVRILGLTAEEQDTITDEEVPDDREVIGRWLDESPLGNLITIFREDGKLYIKQKFKDGSSLKKELTEQQSPLGRRFAETEVSSTGDHWVLDPRGNLQIRDSDGLIRTAKKIE